MSDVDFKNALLAGDPDAAVGETASIPSHAGEIVVRALSRAEVLDLKMQRAEGMTLAEYEAHMISWALVHPPMTPAEVQRWQAADKAGGVLNEVTDKVTELSGLGQGAEKSGVPGTGKQS